MKTLVIDDDEGTLLILSTLLSMHGCEPVLCRRAEEAIERFDDAVPPLVILDLFLPGMSGFEYCRWLRKQPHGAYCYVLAGTASTRPEDLQHILEAGADDYIAKPYDAAMLGIRLTVAAQHVRNLAIRRQLEADLRTEREHLRFLASHDPLTQLNNRAALNERLAEIVGRGRDGERNVLAYLDLDNFKVINDTVGHAAGDRLLVRVASALRNAIGAEDQAFRFGGDEFVLLLRRMTLPQAAETADRIRLEIEKLAFVDGGRAFAVGGSIGLAEVEGFLSAEQAIAAADAACYRAKAAGRNRVAVYDAHENAIESLRQDSSWASRIQDALRARRFCVFFQPIVELSTGKTAFCEALLRMRDENGELVGAGAFLPPAERFGLMPAIDRLVITEACRQLQSRPTLNVSVNLSGQSFADPGLPGFIARTFGAAGVAPGRVVFEVTETAVISDLGRAQVMMKELRRSGFRFALDDFGAGFSSLTYLKRLAVDFLKIDGSFTRDAEQEPANWAFIGVIHALASELGIASVAESVESEASLSRLREIGVDYGQGYLLGRPEPLPV